MRRITLALLLVAISTIAVSAQRGRKPVNLKDLPEPFATPSVRNNPTVVPRPEGASIAAPPGFIVEEFMDFAGMRPRFMMLGPGNEILISDTSGNGSVFVIKDGVRTAIIEKLDRPYGLALKGDQLYVAEPTSVKVYTYDARTMRVTSPGKEIIALPGMNTGHTTRTLAFNRDGSKLYLSVGSQSNINLGEDPMRAAVHRFNPDGTGHETIATGLRNAVGMRFYPGTDDLWVTVHERDELGDDLAPDYATKIEPGGFYGWPIAYIGPHAEPRHKDVDMKKVESTLYPDVILGGHVGPLDIAFYTGKMFPAKYQGGMFVALHGSWNRSQRQGYKIAFIPFKNRMASAGPEDFVSGWMLAPDKKEVWGRPVGLLQMPDGSLLVSDDGGRKLWRISYPKA
ncbi:MAG TPA: PQQ-dependent sugar dehydrogenase [Vicinamibacterales bacterium]|nr:PQQ-dependent sugar dehydrogenase [Vicinamibacterales bacterium]